ncbi:hypothetical protein ACFKHW_09555 [Bradyrhizobium lupini]|uniref:hypothetical protein n=1 Tax=Rhizobium lupini TaxID=136996 RepID=UPI0036706B89
MSEQSHRHEERPHPTTAHKNVRPVVAALACAIVNAPFATALTYIVPLPASAAAFADAGTKIGTDPAAQFAVVTVVLDAPVAKVTLPTAFDLPAASCCIASTIFFRSVSAMPGT